MPRTVLNITDMNRIGLEVDLETALAAQTIDDVNGSKFDASSESVVCIIENNNLGAAAVTFVDVADDQGRRLTTAETTTTIPAGEKRMRGPFRKSAWAQKSGDDKGEIQVDSDVDSVNILPVLVPRL